MAKDKPKSFLVQQREKLKAQKAAKAAKNVRGTGAKNARIIQEGTARMLTGQIPKTRGQTAREKALKGRSVRARKERLERSKPENQPGARRREAVKRQATAKANLAKAKPAAPKAPKPNFKAALATKVKNLSPALKKLAMRGAMLLSGDGSGQALILAKSTSDLIDVARGSTAEQRNASKKPEPKTPATAKRNTTGRQGGSRAAVNRKPAAKPEPKPTVLKRNRRGRPTKVEAPKSTKPRVSNIPKSEGTGGKAETTLKYGAGKPKVKPIPKKPAGEVPSAPPKPKPIPKATPKNRAYAADSRNKEYDRLRKAGKLKEASALGKKIYSDKFGKKDKKKKSRALRAGYPGNQNY